MYEHVRPATAGPHRRRAGLGWSGKPAGAGFRWRCWCARRSTSRSHKMPRSGARPCRPSWTRSPWPSSTRGEFRKSSTRSVAGAPGDRPRRHDPRLCRGDDHRLREPSRALLELIRDGAVRATTTVEVIQEFCHVRARGRPSSEAAARARDYARGLAPLLRPEESELYRDSTSSRVRVGSGRSTPCSPPPRSGGGGRSPRPTRHSVEWPGSLTSTPPRPHSCWRRGSSASPRGQPPRAGSDGLAAPIHRARQEEQQGPQD